jgi:NHLM bacteriocin system ABC transporter ATP-binding protein
MKSLENIKNIKCIEVDGRQQIIIDNPQNIYMVNKGKIFLHFAEIDEQGINKRKHFIGVFEVNQLFSGCLKEYNQKKFALIASGETDTEVFELSVKQIEFDETLKVDILNKINSFYDSILEENVIPQLETFDEEIIKQNNCIVLDFIKDKIDKKENQEFMESEKRDEKNQEYAKKNLNSILSIFGKNKRSVLLNEDQGEDLLFKTCKILCGHMKIEIALYSEIKKCVKADTTIEDIARISKFAVRDIILEEKWWETDNGPLIVLAIDDERPLACVPISPSKYMVYDVKNNKEMILTEKLAIEIIPRGTMFYRPFPNKKLKYKDILAFGGQAAWKRDIVKVLLATLVGSLIGLLLPELNQRIFDDYIPEGAGAQLFQMGMLVLSFMVGNFLVSLTKAFSTFRASNRMEYAIQAATFDRLMNLPGKFYSKYTSGELASRAMGITAIFNTLADIVISTFLSSIFSFLYLWRMFKYSKELSIVGIIMVAVTIVITIAVGFIKLRFEKKLIDISNKMAGVMYQLLLGISKIRISGSEDRAIYRWNKDFLKTRKLIVDKEKLSNIINAFNNLLNTAFTIVIYYMLVVKKVEIGFGAFMAYSAAFGSFSGAMMGLADTFVKVNRLIPIYEKAKPVLEAVPEYEENLELVGDLSGAIEVSNVNFRYSEEGPLILKDVSFSIKPGEYVGIVGPSGGGKSTLLKVLLGFEKLNTGRIFYDDKDLEAVDKRELRKKLGVVLQDGQLIAGSIYENITITNSRIPMKDVREVVKEAGLEEDINKMPMGLYTNLMEDAGTISGGQKQRILIARAIVNKPKIIFFDEATSALDNITQAIVCESLEKLNATRVVIAHRLSTIVNCDRIIVIENGEIVEQGKYSELMENKGLFYQLASLQIA